MKNHFQWDNSQNGMLARVLCCITVANVGVFFLVGWSLIRNTNKLADTWYSLRVQIWRYFLPKGGYVGCWDSGVC